jgi:hypothetical protein
MERIALILSLLFMTEIYAEGSRLSRELNFILGKQEKAPIVPKVVTYESWKGVSPKKENDGMIVDETSTALAAPVRENKKVIINLGEPAPKKQGFVGPRKRSR